MAGMAMVVCLILVATLAAAELAAAQGGGFGGGPGGGGGGRGGGGGGGGFGGGRAGDCQDFVDACRDFARFNQRFPGRLCCQATNRVNARCMCRVDNNLRGRYLAIPRACGISFGSPNCGFDEVDESKP